MELSWRTIGIMGVIVFGVAAAVFSGYLRKAKTGPPSLASPVADDLEAMHICELRLGIDWRARRDLQEKLRWLAVGGDTDTPEGLARLLRETALALRGAELSWLYVNQRSYGPMGADDAERCFDRLTMTARAAFSHELVRNADGQVLTAEGPAQAPRPDQGAGVVVVTLLVGTRVALPPLRDAGAQGVARLLDACAGLPPDQLLTLEVIWSPADEDDRMSTAELEPLYPDLKLIDPASIAGRVFCAYCRGPFAMELLACPHCGAPVSPRS